MKEALNINFLALALFIIASTTKCGLSDDIDIASSDMATTVSDENGVRNQTIQADKGVVQATGAMAGSGLVIPQNALSSNTTISIEEGLLLQDLNSLPL